MPIRSIKIKNFKSLKNVFVNFGNDKNSIHCLLGRNGSGKSSLLDAIKYFYDNLAEYSVSEDVIDDRNPYTQKMEITLVYELSELMRRNTNRYLLDALNYISPLYLNERNQILIKLIQHRDNRIKWYPDDKKLLKIMHRLFPIYLIDTRFLDLQDWDILWDIMSDLSQTTLKLKEGELEERLDAVFRKVYGDKYVKVLKKIEEVLKEEDLTTNQYNYTMRFKSSLISRLGSTEFVHLGNRLGYYSDGLNSFKLLTVVLRLIPELASAGWKDPLLIMDEPEIGLHPQYIAELANTLTHSASKGLNIMTATHSPNLVDELIKKDAKVTIYRVSFVEGYSRLEKMKEIAEAVDKPRITINETNCYFADSLVFVEGSSEMQFLTNRNMKELFPCLDKVHIYSYDSNDIKLKFTRPEEINFNIPYLLLIDMDKILKFRQVKGSNRGQLQITTNVVNPLSSDKLADREKFLYYSDKDYKKRYSFNMRQYIKKMLKNSSFCLLPDLYYVNDGFYDELIRLVKIYCIQYHVFPVKTTVEGLIVTEQSFEKVLEWIYREKKCNYILQRIFETNLAREDTKYSATILRLACSGKLDTLQTLKQTKAIFSTSLLDDINELKDIIGKKTDGWMTNFIDYYFDNYINSITNVSTKRKIFERDFPELYQFLQIVESMV